MADIADEADIIQESRMQQAIHAARTAKPTISATGQCHFCESEVGDGMLFCAGGECQEDWERLVASKQRAGARVLEAAL